MDCTIIYCLLIAWVLDLLLGDPAWLPHPVVFFGKWIAYGERLLNKGKNRMTKGAAFVLLSIAVVFVLTFFLFRWLTGYPFIYDPLCILLIFFCLAGHTLRKEVRDVFKAVDISLEAGRKQVGRIVGRDTSELSAQEIRTAGLETLAENLNDGVIAPLCWFLLLGVPGMLTYKLINTFDSMIAYRNQRYKDFGCWAARIDDVANYIPARLTAFMIILFGWIILLFPQKDSSLEGRRGIGLLSLFSFVLKYGPQHASPNSGWPEAALAGILNCRFGGPHNYFGELVVKPFIGYNERALTTSDMQLSITICFVAELCFVVFAALLCWLIYC